MTLPSISNCFGFDVEWKGLEARWKKSALFKTPRAQSRALTANSNCLTVENPKAVESLFYLHLTRNRSCSLLVSARALVAAQTYNPALLLVTLCNTRLWLDQMILAEGLWDSTSPWNSNSCVKYSTSTEKSNYKAFPGSITNRNFCNNFIGVHVRRVQFTGLRGVMALSVRISMTGHGEKTTDRQLRKLRFSTHNCQSSRTL